MYLNGNLSLDHHLTLVVLNEHEAFYEHIMHLHPLDHNTYDLKLTLNQYSSHLHSMEASGKNRDYFGTLPNIWAQSEWKKTPCFLQIAPISFKGWQTPISLFTPMTETRLVLSVIAFSNSFKSIKPFFWTGR